MIILEYPHALASLGRMRVVSRNVLARDARFATITGSTILFCHRHGAQVLPLLPITLETPILHRAIDIADLGEFARRVWQQLVITRPLVPLECLDIAELLTLALNEDARQLRRNSVHGLLKAGARATHGADRSARSAALAAYLDLRREDPFLSIDQALYCVELHACAGDAARQIMRDDYLSGSTISYCRAYEACVGVSSERLQVQFLDREIFRSIPQVRAAKRRLR